jgi:hypothetical protein
VDASAYVLRYKSERGGLGTVQCRFCVRWLGLRAAQEHVAWAVNLSFQSSLCVLHRTWKRQFRICFAGPDLVTTQHAQTVIRAFLVVLCFSLFQALLNNSHYYHMAKHGDLKKVLFFLFAFLWNVVCVRAEVVVINIYCASFLTLGTF